MGEEVGGIEVTETSLTEMILNRTQLNPGIWLYTYLLHSKNDLLRPGNAKDVSEISWQNLRSPLDTIDYTISLSNMDSMPESLDRSVRDAINKVLEKQRRAINFGNLLWRPGIKETIQDYFNYLKSPTGYIPRVNEQVSGRTPIEIFDFLEEYKEEEFNH